MRYIPASIESVNHTCNMSENMSYEILRSFFNEARGGSGEITYNIFLLVESIFALNESFALLKSEPMHMQI